MPRPLPNRNRVRLIGGQWRSRVVQFPDAPDLRPTPDRVRETLFNWLQPSINGACCLDLFAGSGALGFEALSRGADVVVALETHAAAAAALQQNATLLQTNKLQLIRQDALRWLDQAATQRFDVVFLDPPFAAHLHARCCALLQQHGWLNPNAVIYLEDGSSLASLALPAGWRLTKHKQAGDVFYGLVTTGKAESNTSDA
ncbi:MAG TPA: 16S rRNA (guanine(966)-N(2))-methyltransferase RsmD [Candidatus Acidoferrum sp.]|nr:16S rRNA (guanine(966)-N(2))-methyltransferase RsmD [Candidatus Acidoferrum sp.]